MTATWEVDLAYQVPENEWGSLDTPLNELADQYAGHCWAAGTLFESNGTATRDMQFEFATEEQAFAFEARVKSLSDTLTLAYVGIGPLWPTEVPYDEFDSRWGAFEALNF